jgi:hypothetical protein
MVVYYVVLSGLLVFTLGRLALRQEEAITANSSYEWSEPVTNGVSLAGDRRPSCSRKMRLGVGRLRMRGCDF